MIRPRPLRLDEKGFLMPAILSFIIAMGILSGAVLEVILTNFNTVGNNLDSQKAFNIAEAGVNYYLWHLSHNGADFKDGQSTPATPDPTLGYGPYVHTYINADGATEGTYTLWINPQGNGSTVATVRSIGQAKGSNITRTVSAQLGAPSFASYGVVSDSALWFGNNESSDGPVHSNQGIRMDGSSDAEVSSANVSYTPTNAIGGCANSNCSHDGVWCDPSVTAPVNCNSRNKLDWKFNPPAATVDFNAVSSSLCTMKKVAFGDDSHTSALVGGPNPCSQTPTTRTAAYIPQYSSSGSFSVSKGYLIKLNSNGTYDLSLVNSEDDRLTPYTSALGTSTISTSPYVGKTGIPIPPSGVIFAEDNVWVLSAPNFHGRVTIASGRLANSNSTNIVIAGPLKYSTKNGSDAIGLVAEDSVYIAPYAPTTFPYEIDGALLAENGNVQFGENGTNNNPASYRRNSSSCGPGWINSNQNFIFYGSAAMRQTWTWSWLVGRQGQSCGNAVYDPTYSNAGATGWYITGFEYSTTQYDYNLQYAPPPSYPVTSGYNVLSWREVLTKP
jgi:hypothetical protein